MEAASPFRRFGHGGVVVKEENKRTESNGDDEGCKKDFALEMGRNGRAYEEDDDMKRSSPERKDISCSNKQVATGTTDIERSSVEPDHSLTSSSSRKEKDDQLESTRAEMGEVREENQRLKMYLNQIMKEYQTLQIQFQEIVHQQESNKSQENITNNNHQETEETELVSLSLGSFSSNPKIAKDEKNKSPSHVDDQEGLSLGLDHYKNGGSKPANTGMEEPPAVLNSSPASSLEEPKEEAVGETWPPSKVLKAKRSPDELEVSQQNPVKKARVCVRVRCDTPTMNDGCQWRKYGQKIAKGNPCPRAYYRCTVAPSCPVRKQVQRCAEDMSILITTYEGNHNHPLPISATAMASTTSAAASMLLSGSSTSGRPDANPSATTTLTTAADLHGYSFDTSKWKQSIYLPNPNSYSSSAHPTITLDLTSNPSLSSSSTSSSSSSLFNKFSSSQNYPYPSTSLNFGSSESNPNTAWNNNGLFSYSANVHQPYNRNQTGTLGHGRTQNTLQNNLVYQNYAQKSTVALHPPQQSHPADPIAAATKAIAADPSFQSAIAAALASIMGGQGRVDHNNNLVQKLNWPGNEQFPASTTATALLQSMSKGNTNGCGSTFLNKTASSASIPQPGNLKFSSPSLSFSTSKSASASPARDSREHTN
ncbi:hypothetical protein UlMin_008192 [Ulmus minor]